MGRVSACSTAQGVPILRALFVRRAGGVPLARRRPTRLGSSRSCIPQKVFVEDPLTEPSAPDDALDILVGIAMGERKSLNPDETIAG